MHEKLMDELVNFVSAHLHENQGGPFGAMIVKDNQIIAQAFNQVVSHNDPTAHAEMEAIRQAGKKLNTFDLSGCEIYCTSKPCVMCLGAIYWARLNRVFYSTDYEDVANIGFDDRWIYDEVCGDTPSMQFIKCRKENTLKLLDAWFRKQDKILY